MSEVIGSWKIIAIRAPRMLVELAGAAAQDLLALELDAAGGPAVGGQQAHHRQEDLALARAGFADDAERLARLDREADLVDRLDRAVRRGEADVQIADLEDGAARLSGPWGRARRAARRR